MKVGIGLPTTIPGVDGERVIEWGRRSDEAGFTSLGTIDRLVYPNYEPLVALAAVAAVTKRARLLTDVLLAPLRHDGPLLAKQAASLDQLSGGRLTLGLGLGGRDDDFEVAGASKRTRGATIDQHLQTLDRYWSGEITGLAPGPAGPPPAAKPRPEVLIAGSVDASFARAARYADGWTMGGGTPDNFRDGDAKMREAWVKAGREGEPRNIALTYYALGPKAEEAAESYLRDYYGFLGDVADMIVAGAAKDADTVRGYIAAFEDAGCDELVLFPCSPDLTQVDLLAEAAGLS
jgi:alkanesulfonate monooxygenase SsuD/methylene tetrahydromethanopterin reductase-like flavin-dependent oxidoreductase (luciferase family)